MGRRSWLWKKAFLIQLNRAGSDNLCNNLNALAIRILNKNHSTGTKREKRSYSSYENGFGFSSHCWRKLPLENGLFIKIEEKLRKTERNCKEGLNGVVAFTANG